MTKEACFLAKMDLRGRGESILGFENPKIELGIRNPKIDLGLLTFQLWGYRTKGVQSQATSITLHMHPRRCDKSISVFSAFTLMELEALQRISTKTMRTIVNSSVVGAVEVRSGSDGFLAKMRDGRQLPCVHNNPQRGHLPNYAPHPAIVLKMEDGTGLLLPIIVLEMPSVLMAAMTDVQIV